jgi:hypothetical protein
MPIPNHYCCDEHVRQITSNYSHKKCSQKKNRIYSTKVTGEYINQWLIYCREVNESSSDDVLLNPHQHYSICYNLKAMIKKSMPSVIESRKEMVEEEQLRKLPTKRNSDIDTNTLVVPATSNGNSSSMNMSRSARLKARNGTLIVDHLLPGIKEVKVVIDGEEDQFIDIKKNEF